MPITLDQALTAGKLAAEIQNVTRLLSIAQNGVANNWLVSKLAIVDKNGENELSLITSNLDPDTSMAAMQYTVGVYQKMLDDLNAQLAALV